MLESSVFLFSQALALVMQISQRSFQLIDYYYYYYYYYYDILSSSQFLLGILYPISPPSCSSDLQHLSENMCHSQQVIYGISGYSCLLAKPFETVPRTPIISTTGTTTTSTWCMHHTWEAKLLVLCNLPSISRRNIAVVRHSYINHQPLVLLLLLLLLLLFNNKIDDDYKTFT